MTAWNELSWCYIQQSYAPMTKPDDTTRDSDSDSDMHDKQIKRWLAG